MENKRIIIGVIIGICLDISFGISGSLIFSKKDKDK